MYIKDMEVAKPYQIRLPDPSSSVSTLLPSTKESDSKPSVKDKPRYYTLAEGTTLRSGPLGGEGEFVDYVKETTRVRVLRKIVIDGDVSFFVEIESPPEQKGRHWVTKRFGKGHGFL